MRNLQSFVLMVYETIENNPIELVPVVSDHFSKQTEIPVVMTKTLKVVQYFVTDTISQVQSDAA